MLISWLYWRYQIPLCILVWDLIMIFKSRDRTIVEDTHSNNLPLVLDKCASPILLSYYIISHSMQGVLQVVLARDHINSGFLDLESNCLTGIIYRRYLPSVATHFQFTTPRVALRFKITLTRGWTIPIALFPSTSHSSSWPKMCPVWPQLRRS